MASRLLLKSTLCLAIGLTACSSQGTFDKRIPVAALTQIHSGKTDKDLVQQLLGAPRKQDVSAKGEETWTYRHDFDSEDVSVMNNTRGIGAAGVGISSSQAIQRRQIVTISFSGNTVSSCILDERDGAYGTERDCDQAK